MPLWSEIRRRVLSGELSLRQACAEYGLNFRTAHQIVHHADPPAYTARAPRPKPVLGAFLPLIHELLDGDRHAPPKQRHTARRIYERLRDAHGYQGGPRIVRDALAASKRSQTEVFVPLLHPPGEAQADCGRAEVVGAGVRCQAALFVLTLPHSNARFGCLFPRECAETFPEGHARAFAFFGGVATRISYDNSKTAVTKLIGPHERRLTQEFLRLQAHFAFATHFGRVRQAHEKGHVENGVGYVRRNFLVPVPQGDGWEDLHAPLAAAGRREFARAAGRDRAAAERRAADRAAFRPRPAEPFEARRVELVTINALSLGRFDRHDYAVPTACAYQALTATGTIDRVRFRRQGTVVAEHVRCWAKGPVAFEPVHYLALLERQPGALDYARPLAGWPLPGCFAALRRRLEAADPQGGPRPDIRVLRRLEGHALPAVADAVERALALAVADADVVRLRLAQAQQRPAAGFDLAGRPRRAAVRRPPPDLSLYGSLRPGPKTNHDSPNPRKGVRS
jgi:transposase